MSLKNTAERFRRPLIGFIGQGFIGKNMADDFVRRKYKVVRFALEAPYQENKEAIAQCDIVFIAVPTPTTPQGFCDKALRAVLPLVGKGKIAVIKSTILPGKTKELQNEFPHITLLHSPEFLREKSAMLDTQKPERNIIGLPKNTKKYKEAGEMVLSVLPKAKFEILCTSDEAELIKYGGNCILATRVIFMNTMHDLAEAVGADYDVVARVMGADPRIGNTHMNILDTSGHKGAKVGRGAGGHCFPKDLSALREHSEITLGKKAPTSTLLKTLEKINLRLLCQSEKDMDLLGQIYSQSTLESHVKGGKIDKHQAKKTSKNI